MYLRRDRAQTAVAIMLDVAFHAGRTGVVSGADIAKRGGMLRRGIEPVLQALSRAGLLDSLRGPKGGYRLARAQRMISVHDIIQASVAVDGEEEGHVSPLFQIVIEPLWARVDEEIARKMENLTLDDLIRDAEAAGLQRPDRVPISFSI